MKRKIHRVPRQIPGETGTPLESPELMNHDAPQDEILARFLNGGERIKLQDLDPKTLAHLLQATIQWGMLAFDFLQSEGLSLDKAILNVPKGKRITPRDVTIMPGRLNPQTPYYLTAHTTGTGPAREFVLTSLGMYRVEYNYKKVSGHPGKMLAQRYVFHQMNPQALQDFCKKNRQAACQLMSRIRDRIHDYVIDAETRMMHLMSFREKISHVLTQIVE